MKPKQILKAIAVISVTCISCSNGDYQDLARENGAVSDNVLSIEDAISISNNRMREDLNLSTRSSLNIASVEYVKNSNSTRSESSNGFYILNYENEGGFTMISADARDIEKVYAISDKGSLHAADTLNNENLNWYINTIAPRIQTTGINSPIYDLDPVGPDSLRNYHYCRPLFNDVIAGMGQGRPYNSLCPYNGEEHAFIGCVPLSAAQVMAYYKWPESAQGNTYNWDEMLADANHPSWPILFEILGRWENTNVTYGYPHGPKGHNSSKAFHGNWQQTFQNYGYDEIFETSFNIDKAKTILKTNMPLLVTGDFTTDPEEGSHAYVIDGGYYHISYVNLNPIKSEYLHCIWGGSGGPKGNGYFLYENGVLKDDALWQLSTMTYGFTPIR